MKVALTSDVHLEFGPLELTNEQGADVLILGGDICVASDLRDRDPYNIMNTDHSERFDALIQSASSNFAHTVMVMGNHEHYHGDFAKSATILRNYLKPFKNVHFLDKETVTIDDVTFIGGTLWTDMNNQDAMTMHAISSMMNDFRTVDNSNREVSYKTFDADGKPTFRTRTARFSPADAVEEHFKMLDVIKQTIELRKSDDEKFVVVGHHAPSKKSTHPRYKNETLMNGGYSSDLEEFIKERPQIKLWTHGHTHEDFDYVVGETRIVCNPRGYFRYEERADNFKLKVVEI